MNDEGFNLVKTSIQRKNQVRSTSEQAEPTQREIDELLLERITTETELPPMQPLFRMFDVPCFYRGELVADCGKAKSGKTYFLSILMAASLAQKALALERIANTNLTNDTNNHLQKLRKILIQLFSPLICVDLDSRNAARWSM